jgi:RNA recognition motif-containing protein
VGNLGFNVKDSDISDVFRRERLNPIRVRMLQDQDGKFKGAAFVEFDSKDDADRACRLNGTAMGSSDRRLRINPASNKPPGR